MKKLIELLSGMGSNKGKWHVRNVNGIIEGKKIDDTYKFCTFEGVIFRNCTLNNTFYKTFFRNCIFENCRIVSHFDQCELNGCTFPDSKIMSNFETSNMIDTTLGDVNTIGSRMKWYDAVRMIS